MYYRDCTKAYAVNVLKEIMEEAPAWRAMELIEAFVSNIITTDEIVESIYSEED